MKKSFTNCFALFFGSCFGLGFCGRAPGTNASLLATIVYPVLFGCLDGVTFFVIEALLVFVSIGISSRCERILGKKDPQEVTIDEFVAVPLVFYPAQQFCSILPQNLWLFLLLGLVFFRFFDIFKPLGIRHLQHLPRGWGIVADDLLAAFYGACLLVFVGHFFL